MVHVANVLIAEAEQRPTAGLDREYLSQFNGGAKVEEWRTLVQ
jgi:hypothetical protein